MLSSHFSRFSKTLDTAFKWLPGKLERIPNLEKKHFNYETRTTSEAIDLGNVKN